MKRLTFAALALVALVALVGCGGGNVQKTDNPLLNMEGTPYGIPQFEMIKPAHYEEAFPIAIAAHSREIDAIVNSADAPTFANTVEALSYSGMVLDRVSSCFWNNHSAVRTDSLDMIANKFSPLLTAHYDSVTLNAQLFERVKAVYDARESLGLNPEQLRLVEETYRGFAKSGAELDETKKARLMAINGELASLSLKFGKNVLDETNRSFVDVTDKEVIKDIPAAVLDNARERAAQAGVEGWRFTTHEPVRIPFLTYCTDSSLRRQLYRLYVERGNHDDNLDNKKLIEQMVNLRLEKAQLLGFTNYAQYVLQDRMAKTPAAVQDMLDQLWPNAQKVAKAEVAAMKAEMKKAGLKGDEFRPSDWWFYAEKVRKAKYAFDDSLVRPYFSLEAVQNGIFTMSKKLYGITFKERPELSKYHPDAHPYEVLDTNGTHLAILYLDFFPRESKSSGAWCTSYLPSYRTPDGARVAPVVSVVCNFTPPAGETPSLLSTDEVETFFHEFGHALHAFFGSYTYPNLGETPRDFVEMPSQLHEHFAADHNFLKEYAKHYKTGEPIPEALIVKREEAGKFNEGFKTTELLAASILDFKYHTIEQPMTGGSNAFEDAACAEMSLIPEILPRYRSTYFSHIFNGGYACGYYAYTWASILDNDIFEAFVESGNVFNAEVASALREKVLQWGGAKDPAQLFRDFRGRDPKMDALMRFKGFAPPLSAK